MRHLFVCAALAGLVAGTTGCNFYWGGDDDDDCLYENGGAVAEPDAAGWRNPQSGQCEYWGGGGGGGCGAYEADPIANPDWAACFSYCTGLDEQNCMATSGCRAIYRSDCPEGSLCTTENFAFAECWATAPSGPVQGGDCSGYDAQECSRHDDCVARHYPMGGCGGTETDCDPGNGLWDPTAVGNFHSCAAEQPATGCYSNDECGPGERCNANEVCLPAPGCTDPNGGAVPCPAVCYGYCVPDNIDKGSCTGEVFCDSIPPKCGADEVPGIINGCWSGYCIPVSECETTVACTDVDNEYTCIARSDCAPIYEGVNCTCDGESFVPSCTCESWVYKSCEAAATSTP